MSRTSPSDCEALSESDEVRWTAPGHPVQTCSEMTVRRASEALERDSICQRVSPRHRARRTAEETPCAMRAFTRADEKAQIARVRGDFSTRGRRYVLDGARPPWRSARSIARAAPDDHAARPAARLRAHDSPKMRLLLPGGEVRPGELSLIGGLSRRSFSELHFDTFVLSPCGIHPTAGVTSHLMAEAEVKRAAIEASGRVIAVADSSKLGVTAFDQCPRRKDRRPGDRHGSRSWAGRADRRCRRRCPNGAIEYGTTVLTSPGPGLQAQTKRTTPVHGVIAVFFVHGMLSPPGSRTSPSQRAPRRRSGTARRRAPRGAHRLDPGHVAAGYSSLRVGTDACSHADDRLFLPAPCSGSPSLLAFFLVFMLWGLFQGTLKITMNTQGAPSKACNNVP